APRIWRRHSPTPARSPSRSPAPGPARTLARTPERAQTMDGLSSGRPVRPPFGPGVALALVLGVLAASRLPALPPVTGLAALLLPGAWAWSRQRDWWRPARAFPVGAALFGLHPGRVLSRQLPPARVRGDFELPGTVVQLPVHEPRRTRFLLRVDRGEAIPVALRGRLLRLSWYDDRASTDATGGKRLAIEAGSRWRFTVRL